MTLLKFTPHMISNQPDQTAYLLNKLAEGRSGGGGGSGTLYDTTGQHTDGAMTQKATTDALGTKADSLVVGQQLATKVDKVPGKELSDNNFTDEELGKLNGIQAGAEVNVQSDWDQIDTSADDYIKNKPTIPTATSDLQNDSGFITTVQTGDIADEAVTSAKLASSLYNDIVLAPGTYHVEFTLGARTGNSSHQNFVYYTTGISRVIQPGSSISFVPVEAYGIEIFGPNGVLFSKGSGTSSVATTSIGMDDISNLVFTTYINTSEVTLPTNTSVSIKINGNLTIS